MKHEDAPEMAFIPKPFCIDGDKNSFDVSAENDVNFTTGFPSVYAAQDGKFVKRTEMNELGYISTANHYFRACGGIYTFNQKLANAIGGYPKYAVLEYLEGLNYSKVISLKDNNFVDFTSSPLIEVAGINQCIQGSVDGVNWAFLGEGTIPDYDILFTFASRYVSGDMADGGYHYAATTTYPIATFLAPRDGMLAFKGVMNFKRFDLTSSSYGAEVIVYEAESADALSEITPFTSQGGVVVYSANSQSSPKAKRIIANKWYGVWLRVATGILESPEDNLFTGFISHGGNSYGNNP